GPVRTIKGFILPQEPVVAHQFPPGDGILERRVKSHGRAAVGGELGDGGANPDTLIFAERERFVAKGAADIASLQSALAEHAVREFRVIRQVAGAIPEIILIRPPKFVRQQAAFVAAYVTEVPQMIPLRDDEVGFQRTAELHKHFIEGLFVGDLRESEHLSAQRCGLRRIMPADKFIELVRRQVANGEALFELSSSESLAQVLAESSDAVLAVAIVPVKI